VVPATTEKDVLAEPGDKVSPEAPEQPKDGQADASPDDVDVDDSELPAEVANSLTRKKFNKLLKERRELKQIVQQWEAVRPTAEIGAQLENFARQHDLAGDDIVKGLSAMAALRRGDYAAFYEEVAPFVRKAQEYLGLALPAGIRQQVQQGQMTEAAAREFVRLSMDQQRLQLARTAEQQGYAQQALQQTQNQVEQSVNALEERIAASDPDYRAKQASVKRVAQAMLLERGGNIQTVDEALAITKAAYDEVNATIRRQLPQPHATSRVPNGNGSTRSARAEPSSLMEAALQGLERARNGAAS
jgi:hypothetical protein